MCFFVYCCAVDNGIPFANGDIKVRNPYAPQS